jgi:hypothetical protein
MAMIKLKRLKVMILKGRAILFKIGLIKELRKPKKAPTKTRELKNSSRDLGIKNRGPVNSTP